MTLGEINNKITQLTGADVSRYTSAQRLIDINIWLDKMGDMIFDSQDESEYHDCNDEDYPIWDGDFKADQRDYPYPDQLVNITRVDRKVNDTWVRATPIDWNLIEGSLDDSTVDNRFSETSPRYATKYGSIWHFPKPKADANKAFTVWGAKDVKHFTLSDLTTGTKEPTIDRVFRPMLAYGPSFEFTSSKLMRQAGAYKGVLDEYEMRLRRRYGNKNKDRIYNLGSMPINYS